MRNAGATPFRDKVNKRVRHASIAHVFLRPTRLTGSLAWCTLGRRQLVTSLGKGQHWEPFLAWSLTPTPLRLPRTSQLPLARRSSGTARLGRPSTGAIRHRSSRHTEQRFRLSALEKVHPETEAGLSLADQRSVAAGSKWQPKLIRGAVELEPVVGLAEAGNHSGTDLTWTRLILL
ncbi:hypothetical protein NDU88_003062 [Pleurodeles waltl]|uniref:Uncharacterized protein n=1 Tax=Pleurodeles waltl TaxID=8319 RepID=A0AAV7MQ44_PLEWA|nr:hypothetical protein NDU88_003062 [Pleurodeles waltl]